MEEEKPFYESRVYWSDVIMLPILNAFIVGIPFISVVLLFDIKTTKPVEISVLVSYLILTVIGTFISAKFFIRKYVFYENRLEIVFIYREKRNRTIWYDDVLEVFYWRGGMQTASRMILKFKAKARGLGLDIEERYAQNILLELKKRNVPVKLKVQSVYTRYRERK